MDNKFWDDQFELGGNMPASWVLEANRLMHAAMILFDLYLKDVRAMFNGTPAHKLNNYDLFKPATLLFGLAFENVLKANIIKKNGSRIVNKKLRGWGVEGHDLIGLAKCAGINLSSIQEDWLRRMRAYVMWTGRYPIPKKAGDIPIEQIGVTPACSPLPIQEHEYQDVQDFFKNLSVNSSDFSPADDGCGQVQ